MAHKVIGREGCLIPDVVTTIFKSASSSILCDKWKTLAGKLNIPLLEVKSGRNGTMMNYDDIFFEILTLWNASQGCNATLGALVEVLKQMKLNGVAEEIVKDFYDDSAKENGNPEKSGDPLVCVKPHKHHNRHHEHEKHHKGARDYTVIPNVDEDEDPNESKPHDLRSRWRSFSKRKSHHRSVEEFTVKWSKKSLVFSVIVAILLVVAVSLTYVYVQKLKYKYKYGPQNEQALHLIKMIAPETVHSPMIIPPPPKEIVVSSIGSTTTKSPVTTGVNLNLSKKQK